MWIKYIDNVTVLLPWGEWEEEAWAMKEVQ